MYGTANGCLEKRWGGSKFVAGLPGAQIDQVRYALFGDGTCILLCRRARATIPCGEVDRSIRLINRRRAPNAGTCTAGGHSIKGVLDGPGGCIHLDELSLYQRTISKRRHADINAIIIDSGRTPDEMARGRT